jgi:hypothetical protein
VGDACALQDCTACLAASGEPPCSSSRPAAPALSTAAAVARGLAARATQFLHSFCTVSYVFALVYWPTRPLVAPTVRW